MSVRCRPTVPTPTPACPTSRARRSRRVASYAVSARYYGSRRVRARSDEAAAHDLELPGDLARHLGGARAARRVLAARDRHEGGLDEPELALGGGAEAAQVPRLDAASAAARRATCSTVSASSPKTSAGTMSEAVIASPSSIAVAPASRTSSSRVNRRSLDEHRWRGRRPAGQRRACGRHRARRGNRG